MVLVRANSHEQLFQLLDKGRMDVAINPFVNGVVIIKKLQLEGIRILEPPLVPKTTDSIRKLEASGRIEEIRKQYFGDIAEAPW